MAAAYGKKSYWDDRYARWLPHLSHHHRGDAERQGTDTRTGEGPNALFDWYGRFAHFKTHLQPYLKKSDYILVLGCGSSRMAEELYQSEFTSVANIDFSSVVIKQMQERHAEKPTLTWKVMDVTERLDFEQSRFDVCIDKACLDCVLCADSSTNAVANAIYNIIRVLKPTGTFLLISHWGPEKWLGYLEVESYNWKISVHAITRPVVGVPQGESDRPDTAAVNPSAVHFLYVCEKQGDLLR